MLLFCPFCINLDHCCKFWLRSLSFVSPPLHLRSHKFYPGDCTSINQAQYSTSAIYPLKNTSNNGVVSSVENSRTLLVDFFTFIGKLRTMSSVTEKSSSTKRTLEERLKTFARRQYDRISLALKLGQTSLWLKRVCEQPPENSLNALGLNRFGGLRKLYVMIALLWDLREQFKAN